MAFIPIDAKADVQGSKKGKMTPAQHAQLNAWSLTSKTGILDCLDKCTAQNKIYTASNNKANIVFNRGYFVICGRLVECEQGTTVEVTTPVSGRVNGYIVARFELSSSGTEEFKVIQKESGLQKEDLNNDTISGVYDFVLYEYEATPTTVSLKDRSFSYIPDLNGKLSQFEASLKDEGKPLHGYDDAKGTIEERLTKLGFKKGVVSITDATPQGDIVPELVKMGCWIVIKLGSYRVSMTSQTEKKIGTVSGLNFEGDIIIKQFVKTQQYLNDTLYEIRLKNNGDLVVIRKNDGNVFNFITPAIYNVGSFNEEYEAPSNFI